MEPDIAHIPDQVFRIGRTSVPMSFSRIRPDDAVLKTAGNRYDVVGGAVLYAASSVGACFGETLARFRPTQAMQALLNEGPDEGFMAAGQIPRDWRLQRSVVTMSTTGALGFLDVESAVTQAHLSRTLAAEMVALGYEQPLDISTVCNADRRLSRDIALYAYTARNADGDFIYSGIRYRSRIAADWECWAIFDGTDVYPTSQRGIELADPDLQHVAGMWDLHPF